MLLRVAMHAASLLLGAAVGLAAVVVHRADVLGLPFGLVLAPVASLGVGWALRTSDMARLATSYTAGWVAVFGLLLSGRPEGDFVVAGDLSGYVLIGTAFVTVVLGVTSLFVRDSGSVGPPS